MAILHNNRVGRSIFVFLNHLDPHNHVCNSIGIIGTRRLPVQVGCQYALNNEGVITDIKTLTKAERIRLRPFRCFGCKYEMVARLGEVNEHHFAHKVCNISTAGKCSQETYLHNAAKNAFYQTYHSALIQQHPFLLEYQRPFTCNFYKEDLGFECDGNRLFSYDLTEHFSTVQLESSIDQFRADVLLSSESHKRELLVEIMVTHPCSEEKIASGHPILEIEISDEGDIDQLLKNGVSEHSSNVTLHNFQRILQVNKCQGDCNHNVSVFFVHQSKKSLIAPMKPKDFVSGKGVRGNPNYVEFVGKEVLDKEYAIKLFKDKLSEVFFSGVPVKNCYLCRFHAHDGVENAIFCKKFKESKGSNEAVNCKEFWPFENADQLKEVEIKNKEYRNSRPSYYSRSRSWALNRLLPRSY